MILDDGGDATMYILLGARAEAGENVPEQTRLRKEEILFAQIKKRLAASPAGSQSSAMPSRAQPKKPPPAFTRLYVTGQEGPSPLPAINVNDSVTKSKSITNTAARNRWLTAFAAQRT